MVRLTPTIYPIRVTNVFFSEIIDSIASKKLRRACWPNDSYICSAGKIVYNSPNFSMGAWTLTADDLKASDWEIYVAPPRKEKFGDLPAGTTFKYSDGVSEDLYVKVNRNNCFVKRHGGEDWFDDDDYVEVVQG